MVIIGVFLPSNFTAFGACAELTMHQLTFCDARMDGDVLDLGFMSDLGLPPDTFRVEYHPRVVRITGEVYITPIGSPRDFGELIRTTLAAATKCFESGATVIACGMLTLLFRIIRQNGLSRVMLARNMRDYGNCIANFLAYYDLHASYSEGPTVLDDLVYVLDSVRHLIVADIHADMVRIVLDREIWYRPDPDVRKMALAL